MGIDLKITDKILKFINQFEKTLIEDKKNGPVLTSNESIKNLSNLLKSISKSIEDILEIKIKKTSIGAGTATHTPWIGIDTFGFLNFTVIFYPKLGGVMINICQTTESLIKTKLGKKSIEVIRDQLIEKIKLESAITWDNSYPLCYFDLKDWSRGASYAKSSPVSVYLKNDVDIKEKFLESLIKVSTIFKEITKIQSIFWVNQDNILKSNFTQLQNNIANNDNINFEFQEFVSSLKEDEYIFNKNNKSIDRKKIKKIRDTFADIGDMAENLVVKFEREYLIKKGCPNLAQKVKKLTTDGDGYDVLSFHWENGKEKKIEVKGTTRETNKFFISKNEWAHFNSNNTVIYFVKVNRDVNNKIKITEFKSGQILESQLTIENFSFVF